MLSPQQSSDADSGLGLDIGGRQGAVRLDVGGGPWVVTGGNRGALRTMLLSLKGEEEQVKLYDVLRACTN